MPKISNTLKRMVAGRCRAGRPGYQNTPALSKSQAKIVGHRAALPDAEEDAKHHARRTGGAAAWVMTLDRRFGLDWPCVQSALR